MYYSDFYATKDFNNIIQRVGFGFYIFRVVRTGKKKAPINGALFVTHYLNVRVVNRLGYCFLNLRAAKPIMPNAKIASVDGSGTSDDISSETMMKLSIRGPEKLLAI